MPVWSAAVYLDLFYNIYTLHQLQYFSSACLRGLHVYPTMPSKVLQLIPLKNFSLQTSSSIIQSNRHFKVKEGKLGNLLKDFFGNFSHPFQIMSTVVIDKVMKQAENEEKRISKQLILKQLTPRRFTDVHLLRDKNNISIVFFFYKFIVPIRKFLSTISPPK